MEKIYIGIDNGITGSIGMLLPRQESFLFKIPVKQEQSYTKSKQIITRVKGVELKYIFNIIESTLNCFCLIERPMINPGRWKASLSAIRCLEATLIILEDLKIPYQYIDSKEWQRELLPHVPTTNTKGKKLTSSERSKLLKEMSIDVGCRLFPLLKQKIIEHKDADGLLIAEYAKRKNF